jgi:tRNA-uridine 2-sulfurtransferase
MSKKRVVVAMSGGVDSSVTAALMHKQGFDVVGVTLRLYDQGQAVVKQGTCCAGQDIYDARRVADLIGIPHYVLDYESNFREEVIETFADQYLKGFTPIPCVTCNQTVKFRDLLKVAKDLGADSLATGHYVKLHHGEEGPELYRAKDLSRDQSYFLFGTTREQLSYLHFPLGEYLKPEIRDMASEYALPVAVKPDSQDICFVQNGKYSDLVAKLRPGSIEPGNIVHVDGRVLGTHEGIIHYTVGQRKGLGIGGGDPLYVIKLKAEAKEVIVGPKEALSTDVVSVHSINWLLPQSDKRTYDIYVKLRSAQTPIPAVLKLSSDFKEGKVELLNPTYSGVAPGQAAVFYENDRVLGGGWISP